MLARLIAEKEKFFEIVPTTIFYCARFESSVPSAIRHLVKFISGLPSDDVCLNADRKPILIAIDDIIDEAANSTIVSDVIFKFLFFSSSYL